MPGRAPYQAALQPAQALLKKAQSNLDQARATRDGRSGLPARGAAQLEKAGAHLT